MAFTPSTQLSAVNVILSTIGETPINSLLGSLPLSASVALNALNEQVNAVQLDGFWYNQDTNVTLAADANGNVFLPPNTAKIEINRRRYAGKELVNRPQYNASGNTTNQLYDRRNQTYNLSSIPGGVIADRIVYILDWSQLPESAKRYMTIRAARVFADRWVGAETVHQFTAADELNAKRAMEAHKSDEDELNILQSPSTNEALYRGGFGILRF